MSAVELVLRAVLVLILVGSVGFFVTVMWQSARISAVTVVAFGALFVYAVFVRAS